VGAPAENEPALAGAKGKAGDHFEAFNHKALNGARCKPSATDTSITSCPSWLMVFSSIPDSRPKPAPDYRSAETHTRPAETKSTFGTSVDSRTCCHPDFFGGLARNIRKY
jgi:hypothetical protein